MTVCGHRLRIVGLSSHWALSPQLYTWFELELQSRFGSVIYWITRRSVRVYSNGDHLPSKWHHWTISQQWRLSLWMSQKHCPIDSLGRLDIDWWSKLAFCLWLVFQRIKPHGYTLYVINRGWGNHSLTRMLAGALIISPHFNHSSHRKKDIHMLADASAIKLWLLSGRSWGRSLGSFSLNAFLSLVAQPLCLIHKQDSFWLTT